MEEQRSLKTEQRQWGRRASEEGVGREEESLSP